MSEENKTYRTEQFLIKEGHPLNQYFMDMMYKSNNLYNATNFHLRQLYTGLKVDDNKKLHQLQKEVIDLFKTTIPVVNKNNTEKFEKLVKKDILEAKVFDPKKKRKLTNFSMPTKYSSFCSYELMDAVFKTSKNSDYLSLPSHVNQGVMKQVYSDWSSFIEGVKEYKINPSKFKGKPKPPRYKTKGTTNSLVFSNQVCKIKDNKYLRFPKTNEVFNISKHLLEKLNNAKLVQIRVQKFFNDIKLEVVLDYSKEVKELKSNIKNVMAIDLGVNNLVTCVSNNNMQPVIINGRALKSINQYYNKLRGKLYSDLRINKNTKEGVFTSKRLEFLDKKRHLKVKDFLHKASKQVVDLALANNIDKVIVGYNSSWKENVQMRKDDKQTFINIPFSTFLSMLEYKLNAVGIHFEKFEESYTSQASFLDNDPIPTYGDKNIPKFSGKRVTRGLYISKNGISINADINGACNILRKHFNGDVSINYRILSKVTKLNIKEGKKKVKNSLNKGLSLSFN